LKYAGIDEHALHVAPALEEALDQAVADAPTGRLFALPTYTALLELHELLASRGHVLNLLGRARRAKR